MQDAASRRWRTETAALGIGLAWMLLVQLDCALLWDAGWLSRQASLVHWLVVGVLPPALALWRLRPPGSAG